MHGAAWKPPGSIWKISAITAKSTDIVDFDEAGHHKRPIFHRRNFQRMRMHFFVWR